MTPAATSTGTLNSLAEDLFMELFCDTFGPEKSQHIFIQYPFTDIYGNSRFHLPRQKGRTIQLKDHQQEALNNLEAVRLQSEIIALLYHPNGGRADRNHRKNLRDGKIKADLEVPLGDRRSFKYFREDTVQRYARQYGWDLITAANMKDKFIDFVKTMTMSYSFKPVLLKAMLAHADEKGRVKLEDIVDYFIDFYEDRREKGLVVEKERSLYARGGYTRKDVERNILSNPFKRFEDMRFMKRCRDVEYVEFNHHVFKRLTDEEKRWMVGYCDEKSGEYYLNTERRLKNARSRKQAIEFLETQWSSINENKAKGVLAEVRFLEHMKSSQAKEAYFQIIPGGWILTPSKRSSKCSSPYKNRIAIIPPNASFSWSKDATEHSFVSQVIAHTYFSHAGIILYFAGIRQVRTLIRDATIPASRSNH